MTFRASGRLEILPSRRQKPHAACSCARSHRLQKVQFRATVRRLRSSRLAISSSDIPSNTFISTMLRSTGSIAPSFSRRSSISRKVAVPASSPTTSNCAISIWWSAGTITASGQSTGGASHDRQTGGTAPALSAPSSPAPAKTSPLLIEGRVR